MAVTIHVGSSFEDMQNNPYAVLAEPLIDYFATFEVPFAIGELAQVPLYDDRSFDIEFCLRLNIELAELIRRASDQVYLDASINRDEEDASNKSVTSKEILEFLKALSIVVSAALKANRPIVSIGD